MIFWRIGHVIGDTGHMTHVTCCILVHFAFTFVFFFGTRDQIVYHERVTGASSSCLIGFEVTSGEVLVDSDLELEEAAVTGQLGTV